MDSSIKKLSECPVCFVEMIPPMRIFQCLNGHSLCGDCKDNEHVTTCPSCRVRLTGHQMTRNLLAESFIEAVTNGGQNYDNDIVDDDTIPSAPLLEMEDVNQFNDDQHDEDEPTLIAKYHFTDLLKHNCIVITSNGLASQHKGDFKASKNR